jgi:two-component system response regulator HydG
VRELENIVERAVILAQGDYLTERELSPSLLSASENTANSDAGEQLVGQSLNDVEKQIILGTLEMTGGNKSEASRILGITRTTLLNKMKKYQAKN